MIVGKGSRLPSIKLMAKIRTPWQHIVYFTLPVVYFGLSRDGKTEELHLKQARSTISLFKKLKSLNQNPVEEWKYLKEQVCELWHSLC